MLRPYPSLALVSLSFSPPLLACCHVLCTIPDFSWVIERYADRSGDEVGPPKMHASDFFPIRWAAVVQCVEPCRLLLDYNLNKKAPAAAALGCSSTSVVSECSLLLRLLFAASVCKIRWQGCLFPAVLFQPPQKVFVNWPVWHRAVVHHKEQVLDIINIWLAALVCSDWLQKVHPPRKIKHSTIMLLFHRYFAHLTLAGCISITNHTSSIELALDQCFPSPDYTDCWPARLHGRLVLVLLHSYSRLFSWMTSLSFPSAWLLLFLQAGGSLYMSLALLKVSSY